MAPLRSIKDADYDKASTYERVEEKVQGQPQTVREPDNGEVTIRETSFVADTQIVDPNHPLAVQTPPEGSSVGVEPPLASAWNEGTPEEQFAAASKSDTKSADPVTKPKSEQSQS